MRILWYSVAPWVGSGYGQQTALNVPRIARQGHEVGIAATYGGQGTTLGWTSPDGQHFPVMPGIAGEWGKATQWLPLFAGYWTRDQTVPTKVITLVDVWVMTDPAIAELDMACWTPVDHYPTPPRVVQFFQMTGATPIAMSRFGEQALQESGLNPLYVPHGIDTSLYKPAEDRKAVRERHGIDPDVFLVGMVGANIGCNPPRKAFPQAFSAFARFRKNHEDARLYVHTDLTGIENGINIVQCAVRSGIPVDELEYTDQMLVHTGASPEFVAECYQMFDVLLSPSYGEGFGIPIVEAQACGTPVIVTDWTAMPELCGAGWKIGGDPWYDYSQGAFFRCPSILDIAGALEDAYQHAASMRDQARQFALAYDVDRVFDTYWKPALAAMANTGREVGPLGAVA